MSKLLIDEAVVRQALEALEWHTQGKAYIPLKSQSAITALRQALEQPAQQEPDEYLLEVECARCGAAERGVLTFTPKAQQLPMTHKDIDTMRNRHRWITDRDRAAYLCGISDAEIFHGITKGGAA
jgi:hypothetical protein